MIGREGYIEMNEEILKTIRERGLLLEKDIFELLNSFKDAGTARDLLEKLEVSSGQNLFLIRILSMCKMSLTNFKGRRGSGLIM